MDVSIVVPIYNEERHVAGCIEALLALDYPKERYEIIMVDNNSTDRSTEIARRYPQVRLLAEPQQGDFAARNRGVAEARGEIIAFTDSDTAPLRNWLEEIRRVMADPSLMVALGSLRFHPSSRGLALLADYEAEKNEFIFSGTTKETYYGYTCNLVVRKSVFDDLGPFPPVFRNADVVLVRRAVDRYSFDAVRFAPTVAVERLEVATVWSYFAKQHVYGRDLARYGEIAGARPLSTGERLRVFRRTVRNRSYSPLTTARLLSLLVAGAVCYDLGRLRGV